jgi:hypothetical protein
MAALIPRRAGLLLLPDDATETVHNLGVITLHFETDGMPNAPHQRNPG